MPTNQDARVTKSTEALLKAGLTLLNQNKEASLSEIATVAGVGRATLYRLYKNKEELVKAIAIRCIEEYDEAIKPIDKQAKSYIHAFELLFEFTMPMTEQFQFLINLDYFSPTIPEVEAIFAKQTQEMLELIEAAQKDGCVDKSLPSEWVNNLIEGLFYSSWIQQTDHGTSAEEAARMAFLCFRRAVTP